MEPGAVLGWAGLETPPEIELSQFTSGRALRPEGETMKRLILLALCAGCTFGFEETSRSVELIDQGGIRVRPVSISVGDGELEGVEATLFAEAEEWLAGEAPRLRLVFDYEGREMGLDSDQIERLTLAGGEALLHIDGVTQVVNVTSSAVPDDELRLRRDIELAFTFRLEQESVDVFLHVEADFHCPPFDTTPAVVDDVETVAPRPEIE